MRKLVWCLSLAVVGCTSAPPPQPSKIAAPKPAPVIVPPLPAKPVDWRDRPYTPGGWHYAAGTATYGAANTGPLVMMHCDAARKVVTLSVAGNFTALTIRTSYAERNWPAQPESDGRSSISFAATDPVLDQIAFSRGRFSIAGPALAEIDLPAWAEPTRVIEDCRT